MKRPCSICFHEFLLLITIGRLDLCSECWHGAGQPSPPADNLTPAQRFEAETAIREHMLRRGGADRNRVLKGKA